MEMDEDVVLFAKNREGVFDAKKKPLKPNPT